MKKILLIFGVLSFLLLAAWPALGQDYNEQYQEKQKEIEELEQKINELSQQKRTLSNQISYMNNQIKLTTLKIDQTEKEITDLTVKIGRLEVSLDSLAQALNKRVVATYKQGEIDPIALFFSSGKFANFINHYKYLKVVQLHDKRLILAMETTRTNYDEQKQEVERLKEQLEKQTSLLAQQKGDKESLLAVTKADEQRYRQMLATARAEQSALEKILAGYGEVAEIGPIETGGIIGSYITGASACSSGTHLHFEVAKNGNHDNPASYLKNIPLTFESNVEAFSPGGSWDWPIFEPVRVTQQYGDTFWSRLGWYGGGPHTGIDIVSGGNGDGGSTTVKAVTNGTLNRGAITCGGGTLRYARVDQTDGYQTYYLHLN